MRYSNAFGINSSKVLLGTAYFGSLINKEDSFKIMDRYMELGGSHIDTARLYADGKAEEIIGEWIKSRKPQNIHISTKGGYPSGKELIPRLSFEDISFDIENSLRALGRECIDFYWLHCDDINRPEEEIIQMLNGFIKEGKIKKIGASNWGIQRVKKANEYAKNQGIIGFEAVQIRFSPAVVVGDNERKGILEEMDKASFDFYANEKIPVAAYASQAKGFFSKMYESGEEGLSEKAKERYLCPQNLETLEHLKGIAEEHNVSIATVVCGALCSLDCPDVFPIIGSSKISQLEDSIKGGDLTLTKEELKKIFFSLI